MTVEWTYCKHAHELFIKEEIVSIRIHHFFKHSLKEKWHHVHFLQKEFSDVSEKSCSKLNTQIIQWISPETYKRKWSVFVTIHDSNIMKQWIAKQIGILAANNSTGCCFLISSLCPVSQVFMSAIWKKWPISMKLDIPWECLSCYKIRTNTSTHIKLELLHKGILFEKSWK